MNTDPICVFPTSRLARRNLVSKVLSYPSLRTEREPGNEVGRGAASLLYRNCAEITVLMCEQKPYLALFGMVFAPAQKLSAV